ncbi:MAG: hypothetical protein ABIF77_16415 [bacterium]
MKAWLYLPVGGVLLAVTCCLLVSCGGETSDRILEQDGGELGILMSGARDAVADGEYVLFEALYGSLAPENADADWRSLQDANEDLGGYLLKMLLEAPELERATVGAHITELILHTWFDFTSPGNAFLNGYHTVWQFGRDPDSDSWCLVQVQIEWGHEVGNAVAMDLRRLAETNLAALGLDWELSVGPDPLLAKALDALAAGDLDKIKACSLDGALFFATERGVRLPSVDITESGRGRTNRWYAEESWRSQINNTRWYARELKTEPEEILPYFNAYRIVAMPDHCMQVALTITFQNLGLPRHIAGLALTWSAGYVENRWLLDEMYVDAVTSYEYRFTFATE